MVNLGRSPIERSGVRFKLRHANHHLTSAAFPASIVTCFTPDQNCALLAIGTVDAAQHEILVNAYALPSHISTVAGPGLLVP